MKFVGRIIAGRRTTGKRGWRMSRFRPAPVECSGVPGATAVQLDAVSSSASPRAMSISRASMSGSCAPATA